MTPPYALLPEIPVIADAAGKKIVYVYQHGDTAAILAALNSHAALVAACENALAFVNAALGMLAPAVLTTGLREELQAALALARKDTTQ